MSNPTVRTAEVPAAAAHAGKGATELVDSAVVATPKAFKEEIIVNTIESREANPMDEKEKRLVEYVSKMDELRKTTGEEGFKIQQGIKVKAIVKDLLLESDQVYSLLLTP